MKIKVYIHAMDITPRGFDILFEQVKLLESTQLIDNVDEVNVILVTFVPATYETFTEEFVMFTAFASWSADANILGIACEANNNTNTNTADNTIIPIVDI